MRRNKSTTTTFLAAAIAVAAGGFFYISRKKKLRECYDRTYTPLFAQARAQGVPGQVPAGDQRRAAAWAEAEAQRRCGGDPSKPFKVF